MERRALIVLGIDPGTIATGYGIVRAEGNRLQMLDAGVLRSLAGRPLGQRLRTMCDGLDVLLRETRPDGVAVEGLFTARNVRSALTLAHLRGAFLLTLARWDLDVAEYSPPEVKKAVTGHGATTVKKAVTGHGATTKEQVRTMVKQLLGASGASLALDASDALAVAICHAHTASGLLNRRRVTG